MANQFVNLPAPAGNGSGAAVDVSTFGGLKTVTNSGNGFTFEPTVTIEFSNELVPLNWAPLWTFGKPGEKGLVVAARWMRASVSNFRGGGAPVVDVGGTDSGAQFVNLPTTPGSGVGAAVDTSGLDSFKTIHVGSPFRGALNIEISEDGGATYSQVATFYNPGWKSVELVADFMRVRRSGVPQNSPGSPVVNIGAVDGAAGAPGVFVEDEGTPIGPNQFSTLNFTGAGVTASDEGGGVAKIDIPGAIAEIEDEGTPIGAGPFTKLNFQGGGVVASDAGGGEADVLIPGTTYENEGTPLAGAPHDTVDFVGAGVTAADAGGGKVTVTIPGGISGIVLVDHGSIFPGTFQTIDVEGAGVTLSDLGSGVAQLTVPGGIDGIDVDNQSLPIGPGPFTRLNFHGAGVIASDAGGGLADIEIPGSASAGGSIMYWGCDTVGAAADTRFVPPGYQVGLAPTSDTMQIPSPRAGTLRNLFVRHNAAGGNGQPVTYTVFVNGVATAITKALATGAVGQDSDLVHTVAINQGDRISIQASKAAVIAAGVVDVQVSLEVV